MQKHRAAQWVVQSELEITSNCCILYGKAPCCLWAPLPLAGEYECGHWGMR